MKSHVGPLSNIVAAVVGSLVAEDQMRVSVSSGTLLVAVILLKATGNHAMFKIARPIVCEVLKKSSGTLVP